MNRFGTLKTKLGANEGTRGPVIFAAIVAIAGLLYVLLGSFTLVPFLPERRRGTVRGVWVALSHNLPDIGQAGLEKVIFWIIVALTVVLSMALLIVAAQVTDAADAEPERAE